MRTLIQNLRIGKAQHETYNVVRPNSKTTIPWFQTQYASSPKSISVAEIFEFRKPNQRAHRPSAFGIRISSPLWLFWMRADQGCRHPLILAWPLTFWREGSSCPTVDVDNARECSFSQSLSVVQMGNLLRKRRRRVVPALQQGMEMRYYPRQLAMKRNCSRQRQRRTRGRRKSIEWSCRSWRTEVQSGMHLSVFEIPLPERELR